MALLKCPECGMTISDQSTNCIHCGYPIKQNNESTKEQTSTNEEIKENSSSSPTKSLYAVIQDCKNSYGLIKFLSNKTIRTIIILLSLGGGLFCFLGSIGSFVAIGSDPLMLAVSNKDTAVLLCTLGFIFVFVEGFILGLLNGFLKIIIGKAFSEYCKTNRIDYVHLVKATLSKDTSIVSPAEKQEIATRVYIAKLALAYENCNNYTKINMIGLIISQILGLFQNIFFICFININANNLGNYLIICRTLNLNINFFDFDWVSDIWMLIIMLIVWLTLCITTAIITSSTKTQEKEIFEKTFANELANYSKLPKFIESQIWRV